MSKTIKALCALGLVVTVSACGGNKAPDDEDVRAVVLSGRGGGCQKCDGGDRNEACEHDVRLSVGRVFSEHADKSDEFSVRFRTLQLIKPPAID